MVLLEAAIYTILPEPAKKVVNSTVSGLRRTIRNTSNYIVDGLGSCLGRCLGMSTSSSQKKTSDELMSNLSK